MDVSVGERIAAPADRRGSGRGWPGFPVCRGRQRTWPSCWRAV